MIELRTAVVVVGLFASACASSGFVSSWKSPTAKPLQGGNKVAAVVMIGDEAQRKSAEERLALEITQRGRSTGVPMYQIMPNVQPGDEAVAREALEKADIKGVVVMRPTADPKTGKTVDYSVPPYSSYWNQGFYAHGWGQPWIDPGGQPYDMVVSVDTLIYSLNQNQLVWAGKSKKTNPATLNELVSELAVDTAKELQELALIPK